MFKDLDVNLHKSGLRIGFKPYVSLTILASSLIGFSIMMFVLPVSIFLSDIAVLPSLLFGIGGGMLAGAFTTICFYLYPLYHADKVKRNLDSEIAFAASFMAILAGAGVSASHIFRSLSQIPNKLAIVNESKTIVRDVELFGTDIISALERASKRMRSERFRDLIEGFVATIRSGGDLVSFLMDRSRQNMRLKRNALKKYSDNLGVISEFYVTLLVAGPLLFVIMLSVMGMLGGAGFGILNPSLLLNLLTYIGIPIGSVVFIIVLDVLSPK
ncbi:MAG: type II secretion system F family protein [Candidatus Bathyarchaeota archaeon]|nr:type II secretion system F family protein [Candidatus Bathyarchaeota archaeon]